MLRKVISLLLWTIPIHNCIAIDWTYTASYPWVWDEENGWYHIDSVSDYVWEINNKSWVKNPLTKEAKKELSYPVVDTNQQLCFDETDIIDTPLITSDFYGQDAQFNGFQQDYTDNHDGTITDNVTGLMWQRSPDTDLDGLIEESDKVSYEERLGYTLAANTGGYTDWRLPTIKELYSLIQFNGTDPMGLGEQDTSLLTPFINTDYFDFAYGETDAGARIIDSQYWSSNDYVSEEVEAMTFGVNFADGRIKAYGLNGFDANGKKMFLLLVRGVDSYGVNDFIDNSDETISDNATGLTWSKNDSEIAMNWQEALLWVKNKNTENYLGYNDWRLPNIKELQSIVDYSKSPASTGSPAINDLFNCTEIINEAGESDYAYYWSSTTHMNISSDHNGTNACYIPFGRAFGYMNYNWTDVHGAGSQRSDPKAGDSSDYPSGHGPQGDAIRILNFIRLVRTTSIQ